MKLRAALLTLVIALSAGSAVAGDEPAEAQLVRRAIADATSSTVATDERAGALLERYVDMAGFEARVVSDIAPSLTDAQNKTLSAALHPLLVHRMALRLGALPAVKPKIDAPREENGEVHLRVVYTREVDGDVEVDLVFAKRATPAAPLRIVDATIAGAGLSRNLRASVNKVMRRDGFESLIARLKQLREAKTPGPHKSSDLTL